MEIIDGFGRRIKLPNERWEHIIKTHPELKGNSVRIEETLHNPEVVKRSTYNQDVLLFYRHYQEMYRGKYVCVAVKVLDREGFVITSYVTDKIKRGDIVWKKD